MPYVYQNLQANPYAQSIGELMQRKGEIQARTAENIGQIRARAQEMSGQIAAHAAEAIGQQVASIPGQIQQQKEQTQRTKVADLDLNAKQRSADATKALSAVMKDTPKLSEDGVSVWDTAKITQAMADKGFGPEAGAAAQHLDGINNAFRQTRAAQLGVVQKGAQAVAAAGNDSTLAHHFLDQLEANQIYPKEEVQKYRDFIDADPGNTAKLTTYLMGPQKMERGAPGSVAVNPVTGIPVPGSAVPDDPQKGAYTINGQRFKADGTPLGAVQPPQTVVQPKSYQKSSVLLDGKPAEVLVDPSPDGKVYNLNHEVIENAAARIRPVPSAAQVTVNAASAAANAPATVVDGHRPSPEIGNKTDPKLGGLTPNSVYQSALQLLTTGTYPTQGFGQSGSAQVKRDAIQNKAGAIAAEAGMDQPTFRAFYNANKGSLDAIQKQYDAVQSFIGTADKNADLLIKTLPSVGDLGVPVFNKPLRAFETSVAGDPKLSQFATYLKSTQNEYARILSQPNLAGQLTDSARSEAEQLIDPKATVPQIVASIQALKQEGQNRVQSIGEQVGRIQQRIQGGPADQKSTGGQPIKVGGFTVVVGN